MATSPIYSWPEPDNTDLVKNGALAIRTLGNAIDTTMGTMVAKTVVDAKGDLIAGTAADTVNRLAVGNNGETLVADSSTSTGLRYQGSMAAGKNNVINGGMDIWQRGTSFTGGATSNYSSDRWVAYTTGGAISTFSRQVTNDTTNLPFIQYCTRVQRNAAATSTVDIWLYQSIESANSIPYAGKTVVLSFYARAGANYSAASSALSVKLATGTGTDQNFGAGFTGNAYAINTSATLTTTWQRFSFSVTLASTITELATAFHFAGVGTAGANDYFEITGAQLEVGSVATQFSRAGATIQGELAACQRYFYRFGGLVNNEYFAIGTSVSAGTAIGYASPKVSLRGTPTLSFTTASNYRVIEGTSQTTATSVNAEELSANNISFAFNASGFTIGRANRMNANNTTNGYIDISAEL